CTSVSRPIRLAGICSYFRAELLVCRLPSRQKKNIYPGMKIHAYCILFICFFGFAACRETNDRLFTKISSARSGIRFSNTLMESDVSNVLKYSYFYNGGGVAVGDIDNDGLPDVLFTGNMVPNRLYLNRGNLTFEDVTEKSGVAGKQGWCTGAVMVDVNH